MRVFLVGMPGSGKTTLGSALAKELGIDFVDLDAVIEAREGKNIAAIFAVHGESYFRGAESKALKNVIHRYPQAVISTGGGAPCFGENMKLIISSGTSIFLDVSPAQLAARIQALGLNDRPKLRELSFDQLENYLSAQLSERKAFYQQADLKISGDDVSLQQVLTALEGSKRKTPQSK